MKSWLRLLNKQMISILPSSEQTKEWRHQQSWYANGKQNECELFQKQCLQQITGMAIPNNTHLRLHFPTKEIRHVRNLNDSDGFEYTEDFDSVMVIFGLTLYFNLKFVCHAGGAQTRALRETYHFIQAQLEHLLLFPHQTILFINILDGNQSHRAMDKFHHLLDKPEFQPVRQHIFIGDTHQFQQFWQEFVLKNKKPQEEEKMTKKQKQELGQFYTTHYEYILQNLSIPVHVHHIVEPFVGQGDLLKMTAEHHPCQVECYDIDPKIPNTIQQDTLLHPPCFKDKFILTNPPYLARNKCANKTLFDKYQVNDLYKCFLKELTVNHCQGGIVIVPVNFWCSRRENDLQLRKQFLQVYTILNLNIFEETVFNDTDYSVCSFQFELCHEKKEEKNYHIPITIFPDNRHLEAVLHEHNFFMVGGEIFRLPRTHRFQITRLTRLNQDKPSSNILVKCIDDDKPIHLAMVSNEKIYRDDTPNLTARSYATLVIEPPLSLTQQQHLTEQFNQFLAEYREKYHSLFLTSYREHKRKRISFDLVYHIVGHLLENNSPFS